MRKVARTGGERVRVRDVKPVMPHGATEPELADVEINFHATTELQDAPTAESQRIDQGDAEIAHKPDVEINFYPTTPAAPRRPNDTPDRRSTTSVPASTSQARAESSPAEGLAATVDPGQVNLRDLRIIQLREGRDGEPRQLAVADKAIVLRILEADLAWLKDSDHRAP